MQFYSGFSLKNEQSFFEPYLDKSAFCIAGFSYGAIKAFKEVCKCIDTGKRVDRLQLFSPAFFQTKSVKFKKLQLMGYGRSDKNYLQNFRALCFSPYKEQSLAYVPTTLDELKELLFFEWSYADIQKLSDAGVSVEVYLGGCDAIIDRESAREFFVDVATVIYIKEANHMLQIQ